MSIVEPEIELAPWDAQAAHDAPLINAEPVRSFTAAKAPYIAHARLPTPSACGTRSAEPAYAVSAAAPVEPYFLVVMITSVPRRGLYRGARERYGSRAGTMRFSEGTGGIFLGGMIGRGTARAQQSDSASESESESESESGSSPGPQPIPAWKRQDGRAPLE